MRDLAGCRKPGEYRPKPGEGELREVEDGGGSGGVRHPPVSRRANRIGRGDPGLRYPPAPAGTTSSAGSGIAGQVNSNPKSFGFSQITAAEKIERT